MCSAKIIPLESCLLEQLCFEYLEELQLPLFAYSVSAGFPSPADDYLEGRIDLGKYLIQNPTSTFMMRVKGNSMTDANIRDGDILVIDKSLKASDGMPVVCFLDGEFTLKTFKKIGQQVFLAPANPAYKPIEVTEEMDLRVWGVVVWILHKPVRQ
ncbi:translesion error-prone DNA polymerase V autoproteolytic subunit [Pontibacter sp. HSC-14F20]|uniref:LexA family protein n=1 Tax=Pontibacter sp. HSC-14F20 TaxID=2864136 RepID=UPI001C736C25|nr:translesion error-prone DNA polymerase V autoproteolytic subunit [Pontibacter sp. HSC-14F20]MBX0335402.1 translesion error-prone DNA polymerase V autoproteolytic subunit [Pontibacter sp. HSC-14F20]